MTTSHAGRFVWRELVSTDLPAVRSFYKSLFGWSDTEHDMGMPTPYIMFHHDGLDEDTGGATAPMMPDAPSHWLDYITVDDVDAARSRVTELGGRALTEPMDIPGVGRFAVAMDPTGGVFALFRGEQPGASDTERTPPVGTFCWSQLMARELDAVVPFYAELFGWQPDPMGEGIVVFKQGEAMRASAMQMPPDSPAPTHWLQYVAVDDCDAAFARARELGAQVHVGPTDMPGMGRFAVVADPGGAAFALWKDLSGTDR